MKNIKTLKSKGLKFIVIYFALLSSLVLIRCKDTYTGPYPEEPSCVEYPANDTLELINGTVKLEDTVYYISTYVDQSTFTKYYPCNIANAYKKDSFNITYSGFLRKKEGDKKQYIELTYAQPILNETIITNYIGFVRNRDSTAININERTGTIQDYKYENEKLKLLIKYNGCVKGRKNYITLYKTTLSQGETKAYGFLTAPFESCSTEYLLWYEFDVSSYAKTSLYIYDGVKTHVFNIP